MELSYFMNKIKLPEACISYISERYETIANDPTFIEIIRSLENHTPTHLVHSKLIQYSESTGQNLFELCLVTVCASGHIFKSRYDEKGICEEIFWDCMQDIRYKVNECKKCYHVWGISCFGWYDGYYNATRFELGRLQFEPWSFEQEYYDFQGTSIKKGDTIVNIHIPSSGPLTPESVLTSLRQAYHFMPYQYNNKMFFICKSWLLYPAYKNLFGEKSNIRKFVDLFDIFDSVKDETFAFGCGSVFNTDKIDDIAVLPSETSLQRSFIKYMQGENVDFGRGYGMIVMENEKILNV